MKTVSVYSLSTGQVLAEPVLNKNGMIMLGAGTTLTDTYIDRLRKLGIQELFVQDDKLRLAESSIQAPAIEKDGRKENRTQSQYVVDKTLINMQKNPFIRQSLSKPKSNDRFAQSYQDIINEISQHAFIKKSLIQMHMKDPFLLQHTINVVMLSSIIGFAKNYKKQELYELVVASLLFDIGMLDLPNNLVRKRTRLTSIERDRIEQHTIEGYKILANRTDIPASAAIAALQHHERYDGSGYPSRITYKKIHEFAKIVAIADMYDALVSKRYHRESYSRGDAVELLLGSGNRMFDLSLVKLFVNHISIYPIGSEIMLNSGQIAIITSVDSSFVQRPMVKVIRERDGSVVEAPYEIDLKAHLELVIVDMN